MLPDEGKGQPFVNQEYFRGLSYFHCYMCIVYALLFREYLVVNPQYTAGINVATDLVFLSEIYTMNEFEVDSKFDFSQF